MQAVIYLLTGVALLPASGGIIQAGLKMFGMESRDCVKEINGISPALRLRHHLVHGNWLQGRFYVLRYDEAEFTRRVSEGNSYITEFICPRCT
jgi:hypothetical protein